MHVFGLIGRNLSHSFSRSFFEKKFSELGLHDHVYRNFELASISGLPGLLKADPTVKGLNVTFPYKVAVMEFLDELSPEAAEAGAVNCIKVYNGKTIGHNTDVYGFSQSIKPFLDRHHENALILGTGGASKAVSFALKKFGIQQFFVTSDPGKKNGNTYLYPDVNDRMLASCKLVINCTPLGMYPQVDQCPELPYHCFSGEHLAYDLVYNPPETLFLKMAAASGAAAVNGLSMLHLQAEKSWQIWQDLR